VRVVLKRYYACFDDVGDGKPYAVKDRLKTHRFELVVARFRKALEARKERDRLNGAGGVSP